MGNPNVLKNMNSEKRKWVETYRLISKKLEECEKQTKSIVQEFLKDYTNSPREENINLREATRGRNEEYVSIKKNLVHMQIGIREVKEGLQANFISSETKSLLEAFESKFSEFILTTRQQIETLRVTEIAYDRELSDFCDNMATWEDDIVRQDHDHDKLRSKEHTERLKRDLIRQTKLGAIEHLLVALGGRCGSWDYRDHDVFVRVWTQLGCASMMTREGVVDKRRDDHSTMSHQDGYQHSLEDAEDSEKTRLFSISKQYRSKFLLKLTPSMPGKTVEELEEHVEWYLKYLSLQAQKKELLRAWKDERLAEERHKSRELLVGEREDSSALEVQPNTSRDKEGDMDDRVTARERIARWRAEKELLDLEKRQLEVEAEEKNKILQKERMRQRSKVARTRLSAWKEIEAQEREQIAASEAIVLQGQHAAYVDPAEIRRRRERDAQIAKQRLDRIEDYRKVNAPRAQKISSINVTPIARASRNPQRLMVPTSASLAHKVSGEERDVAEHTRYTTGAHSRPIALHGRDLLFSGRAKPAWCKPNVGFL